MHFAQPLEQTLSQGFVQPLRTRPHRTHKVAMGPEMKNARTSYVQATYKPAYKHRTRTRHFWIYSRTRLRTRTSNKDSNKPLRTTIRTKIFEQARTRFEQRFFFSMKYSKWEFHSMELRPMGMPPPLYG